jgi:hypothetical protein
MMLAGRGIAREGHDRRAKNTAASNDDLVRWIANGLRASDSRWSSILALRHRRVSVALLVRRTRAGPDDRGDRHGTAKAARLAGAEPARPLLIAVYIALRDCWPPIGRRLRHRLRHDRGRLQHRTTTWSWMRSSPS